MVPGENVNCFSEVIKIRVSPKRGALNKIFESILGMDQTMVKTVLSV